jgi:ferric-dicitrate binding protein FerR (iron transport regulator)
MNMKPNFFQGATKSPKHLNWERFELLSAYLDNQVTPAERKQVQDWLDTDREFKKIYLQMLQVEQGLKTLPVVPTVSAEVISKKVFAKIDQQQKNRLIKLIVSLGFIAVFGFFLESSQRSWESAGETTPGDSLIIALNRPIIKLP